MSKVENSPSVDSTVVTTTDENKDVKPKKTSRILTSVYVSAVSGSLLLWCSFGVRQAIGVFMLPVISDTGWSRSTFSIAAALLQLMWGVSQPFIVYLAERKLGFGKVIFACGILYAGSSFMMYGSANSSALFIVACILQGIGAAGNSFPIVLASVGQRISSDSKYKSIAFGAVSSFGSLGQFCFLPMCQAMLSSIGWRLSFLTLGVLMAAASPLAIFLQTLPKTTPKEQPSNTDIESGEKVEEKEKTSETQIGQQKTSGRIESGEKEEEEDNPKLTKTQLDQLQDQLSIGQVLKYAFLSPTFVLVTLGFCVCGFHIAFLTTHLPAYLQSKGFEKSLAAWVIAIFGAGSAIGTFCTGLLSSIISPKYVLIGIYATRTILLCIFYWVPISLATVFVFAVLFGLLWLSTVPPTSTFIGNVFGYKYLGTLTSVSFVSHQIGAFCGAYIGGLAYDALQSYGRMWIATVVMSAFAVVVNVLAPERPIKY